MSEGDSQLDAINLEAFEERDLKALQRRLDKEMERRERSRVKEAQQEIRHVAAKYGLSLQEVMANTPKAGGKKQRTMPPKYRHPDDPSKTWTGRGRRPQWLIDWENQGGDREALRIEGQ